MGRLAFGIELGQPLIHGPGQPLTEEPVHHIGVQHFADDLRLAEPGLLAQDL